MNNLTYILTLKSPVLLSALHGDLNTIDTKLQISGRVILGCLASIFLQEKGLKNIAHKDIQFYEYFLSGKLLFKDAYFSQIEDNKIKLIHNLPLSFHQDKEEIYQHYDLATDPNVDKSVTLKGVNNLGFTQGESILKQSPKLEISFHHSRNEQGISEKVFNYEYISENQQFIGAIECNLDFSSLLFEFSKWLGKERMIYIGRSKNSQYGKTQLEIRNDSKEKINFSRILDLSKINNRIEKISLTLLSDTIILNDYGFYSSNFLDLEKYLKFLNRNLSIEKEKVFKKHRFSNSFNSAWKLKRPGVNTFAAGSTFIINVAEIELSIVKELIESLERNGIGENTHEGFGQLYFGIHVLDEIESENPKKKRINLYEREISISNPNKPKEIAAEFISLASHLVRRELKNKILLRSYDEEIRENKIAGKGTILNRLKEIVNKQKVFNWREIQNSLANIAKKNIEDIQKKEKQFEDIPNQVSTFIQNFQNNSEISKLIELGIILKDLFQKEELREELNKVYCIGLIDLILFKLKQRQKEDN